MFNHLSGRGGYIGGGGRAALTRTAKTFTNTGSTPGVGIFNSNVQSVWNGSSIRLDGTATGTFADSADWDQAGDYCVQMWIRTGTLGTQQGVMFNGVTGNNQGWGITLTSDGKFCWIQRDSAGNANLRIHGFTTTLASNTWYHVAFCKCGTNIFTYLDGILTDTSSAVVNCNASTGTLKLGEGTGPDSGLWGATTRFVGYIDELQVSKGTCRYPAGENFTVPTERLRHDQYSVLLLRGNGINNAIAIVDASNTTL